MTSGPQAPHHSGANPRQPLSRPSSQHERFQGFRALGFRALGFRALGFRVLGFRLWTLGFGLTVSGFWVGRIMAPNMGM